MNQNIASGFIRANPKLGGILATLLMLSLLFQIDLAYSEVREEQQAERIMATALV